MELHFEPVTSENRREAESLSLFDFQQGYIESVSQCMAEADEEAPWRPVAIYEGAVMAGFAMYGAFGKGKDRRVWLDRLLIDRRFQGRGLGRKSVEGLIKRIISEYDPERIYLSVYDDNERAAELYKKEGFRFNGELDTKGEKIMTLELKK